MRALSISRDGVVPLLYMISMSAREDVGRAKTVFSPPVLSLYVKSLRSYKIIYTLIKMATYIRAWFVVYWSSLEPFVETSYPQ